MASPDRDVPCSSSQSTTNVTVDVDSIESVLSHCDHTTVENVQQTNHFMNDFVTKYRHNFSRKPRDGVRFEKEEGSQEWLLSIIDWDKNALLEDPRIKYPNVLPTFAPKMLWLINRNANDEHYSQLLAQLPKSWFSDLKKVRLDIAPHSDGFNGLRSFLGHLNCIRTIEVTNKPIFRKLGAYIKLMEKVTSIDIDPNLGNVTNCTDDDLRSITKISHYLSKLELRGLRNTFQTKTFIKFMNKAHFDENVNIHLKNWIDDPDSFYLWLIASAKDIEVTYSNAVPEERMNFPNRYRFKYGESSFNITFEESAVVNYPFLTYMNCEMGSNTVFRSYMKMIKKKENLLSDLKTSQEWQDMLLIFVKRAIEKMMIEDIGIRRTLLIVRSDEMQIIRAAIEVIERTYPTQKKLHYPKVGWLLAQVVMNMWLHRVDEDNRRNLLNLPDPAQFNIPR